MKLRDILPVVFEFSLLTKVLPVFDSFDAILKAHAEEPLVVSLFSDLKADWDEQVPNRHYRMVTPLEQRIPEDSDFALAAWFAQGGAIIGDASGAWRDMAVAFVLKEKLAHMAPSRDDIALGQCLLITAVADANIEMQIRAWSTDPKWETISARSQITFPESWWGTFPPIADTPIPPLPTMGVIRRCAEQAATPEAVEKSAQDWQFFMNAYLCMWPIAQKSS